ncbi:hypothetical protein QTP88_027993 [Uroleucon formosanum]
MDRFLLNSHKRCEEEESIPSTSNRPTVKKPKYRKYDDSYLEFGFTSTEVNGEERPLCVLCMKVLAPECMLPSKLKRHLETNHKYAVGKSRDYFDRKRKELKQEKKEGHKHASEFSNKEFLIKLAYLCDIFDKLNSLNTSLQGKNMHLLKSMEKISAFIKKLKLWRRKMNEGTTASLLCRRFKCVTKLEDEFP